MTNIEYVMGKYNYNIKEIYIIKSYCPQTFNLKGFEECNPCEKDCNECWNMLVEESKK